MSTPPSSQQQPQAATFNERLNEQLINCLNVQTNVIQNMAQYSQHISLQLLEIKNIVEMLSNRVLTLQQQQQLSQQSHYAQAPSHYVTSYYPTYAAQQPPLPSYHPSMASVPLQPTQIRPPSTTAAAATPSSTFHFTAPIVSGPAPSLVSTVASFHFSTPAASLTTTAQPITTTTPSKALFPNPPPKFTMADTITKSSLIFPATTHANEKPPIIGGFTFGTGGLMAGFPTTVPPVTSKIEPTHVDEEGEGGDDNDSYEPNVSFKPIVKLSAIEVKTGEEDENVLFCERAKLYRFDSDSNQMKERGIGEMKILQHKTSKLCRVLMRREQVLKLCANHQIYAQMDLKRHSGTNNAFVWSAMDFADGNAKHETLCVKFKTDEQANKFEKIFNDAKEINAKKSNDLPSIGKISLNDPTNKISTTSDDDIITIGDVKPTKDQIDRAEQLKLPSTFYLYEGKEPCKGCPGCENDSPPIPSSAENKSTTSSKPSDVVKNDTQTKVPSPFAFGDQATSSSSVVEKPQTKPSVETPSPSPNAPSQYDNKSSIFANIGAGSVSSSASEKTQTKSSVETPSSAPSQHDNKPSSFGNIGVSSSSSSASEKSQTKSPVETPSPTPNAASQYDNKPSIFGNIGAGSGSSSTTSIFGSLTPINSNVNGSIFGGSASFKSANNATSGGFSFPGFGTTITTTTPVAPFQFSTPAASSAPSTTTTTANTSSTFSFGTSSSSTNKPLFGNTPKFSFAEVAKQSSSPSNEKPTSNGTDQRVFAGQGSLIFGTNSTITTPAHNDDEEGEVTATGGGDDDSYEPDVSFKPIVKLSAVEVKTGEEDENVLFCERAKLYRFDSGTNQMKERGIGEMKILQHKTNNLCRIVMRREQVFKLCANHQITQTMELKPHQGTENAYVWSAMDYADGSAKHETLCVKFKTNDMAKRFVKQFNEAKEANAKIQQQQ